MHALSFLVSTAMIFCGLRKRALDAPWCPSVNDVVQVRCAAGAELEMSSSNLMLANFRSAAASATHFAAIDGDHNDKLTAWSAARTTFRDERLPRRFKSLRSAR